MHRSSSRLTALSELVLLLLLLLIQQSTSHPLSLPSPFLPKWQQTAVGLDEASCSRSSAPGCSADFADTRITNTSASLADTATAAIANLLTRLNPATETFGGLSWWQSANAYSAAIALDALAPDKPARPAANKLASSLENLLAIGCPNQRQPHGLRNEYNDDSLWWALACTDAYQAYGRRPGFLAEAKRIWRWVNDTSVVFGADTGYGCGMPRTQPLSAECALHGGVYWTTLPHNGYVNSITTGLFMLLSARLHEVEPAARYLQAAATAAAWLRAHTLDAATGLVTADGVDGPSCKVRPGAYSYNTAVYLSALAALFRATGDAAWLAQASHTASSAMATPHWTDGHGRITEARGAAANSDGVGFRAVLLRSLVALHATPGVASGVRATIRGFVNTNYNMLYERARAGQDWYGGNWFGPPPPHRQPPTWGQFVAVDVLVAGVAANS